MRSITFLAILVLSQVGQTAPVTIYETGIVSKNGNIQNQETFPTKTQYITTHTAISTTASATNTALSTSAISTSGNGIFGLLSTIYSAVTGSSSTSTASKSGSWESFSNLLFGSSNSPSSNTFPVISPSSTFLATSIPSPTSTIPQTSTTLLISSITKPASTTTKVSSNTAEPTSTNGIYDAIYNSSEQIDIDFAKSILDTHNTYRADHGVGALSWASGPYKYAKNNADNYDCSGVLTHTHGQYGENLAAGFPTGPSAVTAWYVEGESFDYSTHNEYNHFTQVVWKDSTQVGCAYKDCSAEGWQRYIVCEYNPPGNFIGEEQENVLPPISI